MPVISRLTSRAAVAGVSAGLLLGSSVVSANAAATSSATFNDLTSAQVLAALPTAAELPPGTKLAGKVKQSKIASATPCGTATTKVALTGASGVAAIYSSGKATSATPTVSIWTVSAAVFGSHAEAASAATRLAEVEVKCPPAVKADGVVLTRTVVAADTSEKGLWKGVRAVYHLSTTVAKKVVTVRVMTTWFERGNVLVQVTESAPGTATNGHSQDLLRKAVTVATLLKLDKAAA